MERGYLLLAFALGGVVWLCGVLSARTVRDTGQTPTPDLPRFWLGTALALPVLVFLATLPVRPPLFAAGHGLGTGFLIGGLAGLLASWTVVRALRSAAAGEPVSRAAAIAAPLGLAVMAAVAPSLWMRDSLLDALSGIAIGWFCAALITAFGLWSPRPTEIEAAARLCLTLGAGSAALFCAMAGLGELGGAIDLVGKTDAVFRWSTPGLVFAALLCVVALLALLPPAFTLRLPLAPRIAGWLERGFSSDAARAAAARRWQVGLCTLVLLVIGRLLAVRFTEAGAKLAPTRSPLLKGLLALLGPSPIFPLIGLGLLVGLVAWWVVADRAARERAGLPALPGWQGNALAILTVAAGVMVSFQMIKGFGVCLLLTAALVMVMLAVAAGLEGLEDRRSTGQADLSATSLLPVGAHLTRLLLLGGVLALYRLFMVRYSSELRGVGLTDHYALFGLLCGILAPPVLAGFLLRSPEDSGPGARLLHLCIAGVLTLALPTVIVALWGAKCLLALFIGLALATVLAESTLFPALLALAVALAMTQWLHHVLPLAQMTRDQKVYVLFWTTVVTLLLMLASELGGRWQARLRNSPSVPPPAPSKGAAQ